jgi:pimeloyl-ACP methyl ester carboxylesterase
LFFEPFINEISQHYRTIAPDIRGSGYSSYVNPLSSLDDVCEDLKHFMEALKIPRVTLLGWSAGGAIAQLFACKYPSLVDRLVLVASVGPKGTVLKNEGKIMKEREDFLKCQFISNIDKVVTSKFYSGVKFMLENDAFQQKNLPSEDRLVRYIEDIMLQRNTIDIFCALNKFNISKESKGGCDGTGQISEIQGPCLLIHGSKDDNVKCSNSWEIKKYLAKKADIEIIEDGRHFLFEPKTAKKVAEIVRNFLGSENSEGK